MKDVKLPDNPSKKTLLLEKHADYIEAFEKDKDDYVREDTHTRTNQPQWFRVGTAIGFELVEYNICRSIALPSFSVSVVSTGASLQWT